MSIKIAILSIATKDSGGVYQYTMAILEAMKYIESKYDVIQIRTQGFPRYFENDIIYIPPKRLFKIPRVVHGLTGFKIGNLGLINLKEQLKDIDLIISPIISLLPFHLEKPYVITLHDFQHEYYPQFFSLKERLARKIIYRTGKYANLVIVESRYVKSDVVKFLNVNENKIKVLPSPPPSYLRDIKIDEGYLDIVKQKYNLPDNYVLYPAQFWYHKNHINLLVAIDILSEKFKLKVPLILAGSKKNNFENVMQKIDELGLNGQVKYLGYVPDEDMPYLYKLATALIMPSLFESVSLPIWEAFYLGTPVIASNICAIPEQVGNAGLIFDPLNPQDMAEKIYLVWTDEVLRNELIKKGYDRVRDLTIENYAREWQRIIEKVLSDMDIYGNNLNDKRENSNQIYK